MPIVPLTPRPASEPPLSDAPMYAPGPMNHCTGCSTSSADRGRSNSAWALRKKKSSSLKLQAARMSYEG